MAKDKAIFTCSECGGSGPHWFGKGQSCSGRNTLVKTVVDDGKNRLSAPGRAQGMRTAQSRTRRFGSPNGDRLEGTGL